MQLNNSAAISSPRNRAAAAAWSMNRSPAAAFPCFLFLLLPLFRTSDADVGTAASYQPPYLPTACYGDDSSQIPTDNMFAAAGEGIWNNGASCGRQYKVGCLSSTIRTACVDGDTVIQVKIVDRASTLRDPSANGTTMVLSAAAFTVIAELSAQDINIEFMQV